MTERAIHQTKLPDGLFVKFILALPTERIVALSMALMALGIALEPDSGVAGYINQHMPNATSWDFAILLAFSALFLFVYDRDQRLVFIMTLPLWAYLLLSVPYVLTIPGAPPTLPIVCLFYLLVTNRIFHYHRLTGYYDPPC